MGEIFLLAGALFIVALNTCVLISAFILHRQRRQILPDHFPALSFIKPLHGVSPALKENLRSCFALAWPAEKELIFAAGSADDPAWEVVKELQAAYPHVAVKCLHTQTHEDWQPKTRSLAAAVAAATHECLIVSDDDVCLSMELVRDLVNRLHQPEVGTVYAQPFVPTHSSPWSLLEGCFINFSLFMLQPLLSRMKADTLSGNVYAITQTTLRECGGYTSIRKQIADDTALGKRVRQTGKKLVMSPHPVMLHSGTRSFSSLVQHQLRWLRVWRAAQQWKSLPGYLYSSVFLALPGCIMHPYYFRFLPLFALGDCFVMALIYLLLHRRRPDPGLVLLTPFMLLLQQVLSIISLFSNRVRWKGNTYRFKGNGEIRF